MDKGEWDQNSCRNTTRISTSVGHRRHDKQGDIALQVLPILLPASVYKDGKKLVRPSFEERRKAFIDIQPVLSAPQLLSGHPSLVLFELFNHGPERQFTLTAEDDCGYLSDTSRYSVQAQDSLDSNYAVVHLTVLPEEPDVSPLSCSLMRVESDRPLECWSVSLTVKDHRHSGLAPVKLTEGQGTLKVFHEQTTWRTESLLTELSENPVTGHISPVM
ncbi:uncharacterized protein [Hoplias malabaricus]|uniref:uncharacterized protein isoform X2 n=1 Tax=Hoplias malabaricus TaxID=27720 RepID=UPI003463465F